MSSRKANNKGEATRGEDRRARGSDASRITEQTREVRAAYERRKTNVASDLYAPYRPEVIHTHATHLTLIGGALSELGMTPPTARRALDVGCGTGDWLVEFETMGFARRELAGIDVNVERVDEAKTRLCDYRDETGRVIAEGADVRVGNAAELPWAAASFDIVLQMTLFTSILDHHVRREAAKEMLRVLKPGGAVLWLDFRYNNPRNADVKGIRRRELLELFEGCSVDLQRVTLAPPLLRRIAPRSRTLTSLLESLRFLNTHYFGVIRPNAP